MARALEWDSAIENDGGDFTLLAPGDYSFVVSDLTREQYEGSAKVPPCPRARIELEITAPDGSLAHVRDSFLLVDTMEWRICQFFLSLGFRKHGERMVMDWNKVMGARGSVRIKYDDSPNAKKDANGKPMYNAVDKYLEPVQAPAAPAKKWTVGK